MCGILGFVNFHEEIEKTEITRLKNSLDMMSSRGPDAKGFELKNKHFLGHRRLSILDLRNCANQPMKYKAYTIVFNGEIYNFKQIKKKLITLGHDFNTTSDTEVILHAYEEWGTYCVNQFDGMWAFCIHDIKNEVFFLSRDRIGEKPLIYYKDENKFIFSSEIPPLLNCLEKEEISPNWQAVANFNTYNFRHIPTPYTAYKNIYKLEPGYNLTINSAGEIRKEKYFKLDEMSSISPTQIENKLRDCISQTMISDAPVGVFLSGGVDSSLICSFLKGSNIKTYSLGQDDNDPEIIRSKRISQKLNLKNTAIKINEESVFKALIEEIKKIVKFYGEPINLFQIIYSDLLLKEMQKDGIKVAIGGNGADELFYGYDGQNKLKLISSIKSFYEYLKLSKVIRTKKGVFKYLNSNNAQIKIDLYKKHLKSKKYLNSKFREFLYERQFVEYSQEIHSEEMIDIFNWLGLRIENEHSVTNVADISGSRRGIEIRTPFLNKDMIEYAMNLSHKYKVTSFFSRKNNKYVLKRLLEKRLGREFAYYKKMGFGYNVNFGDLIRKNKKEFDYYFKEILPHVEAFDLKEVQRIYKEHLTKEMNNQDKLLEILIVCIWFEQVHWRLR